MIERWREIREEITEPTTLFGVYKLDTNKVAKFLAKLEERLSKIKRR